MDDTIFVADTNVVHWIDLNSLRRPVFTTDRNIEELERISPEQEDVLFLNETCDYFARNRNNVLSEDDPYHGLAMKLFARRLLPYKDLLAKNIVASCLKEGLVVRDPGSLITPVLKHYRGRLRGNHPELERRMTPEMRDEIESVMTGTAVVAGLKLLSGEEILYSSRYSATADRGIVGAAYALHHKPTYVLSNDTDVKLFLMFAGLRLGKDGVVFVDKSEMIPQYLQKTLEVA